ncbi:MAG TPA: squalene--hopene cyclase [Bacillales bacterium]|nr:squalene--hopene cyclase [Bacillales bacterium]
MDRMEAIKHAMDIRIESFIKEQRADGSWRYCFEGPVMTDAYMIITLRSLEINDEPLIQRLAHRLSAKQEETGTWKAYPDEKNGNLTATVEAYVALLYSGYRNPHDKGMNKAAAFIRSHGGIKNTGLLTRAFLSMNGLFPWPNLPVNPAYIVLFPLSLPVNFFEFSSYARAHAAPVMVAADHRFALRSVWTPDIRHLNIRDDGENLENWPELDAPFMRSMSSALKTVVDSWKPIPRLLQNMADKWIERYMLARIEPNGTLLSYASTTFLMIYGLLALGYPEPSPVIQKAVQGLKSLIWYDKNTFHLQNSPSAVWDTGLMNDALLGAGVDPEHPSLQKAANFLLIKQQEKPGDWVIHNPGVIPGGWGFSDSNTIHPDIDDTHTALRTMKTYMYQNEYYNSSLQRRVRWLLSMQNQDGGWAAFEKNTHNQFLTLIPLENMEEAGLDPSTPDLTGRTLQFLGRELGMKLDHPQINAAVSWLQNVQQWDGSWYGRWGVCYIYGTWAALTGLKAAGISDYDPCIRKAVNWLEMIQNKDGGWGESCISDVKKHYVPLGSSTIVQTAWAVDALITVSDKPTASIERGIDFLLDHNDPVSFEATYPVGAGLPGVFYETYHGYPRYWPLLAVSHYYKKYQSFYDD